ncbi:MAG: putative o-succinylbenzoate--CoA ligase, partial [Solirubrobacterales bacterium]|nr:putative o-succinylbenzoate--CoA ligase [Solirubrobacterales bacterium]
MTREDVSVDGAGIAADWLLELPRRQPDAVALIDAQDGSTVTFAEMDAEARRVAGNLLAAGLQRGDRLAVLASNSVALAKLYFGCLYAGVCVVPLNPVLSDDEVGYILGHAGARHLAFDAPFTERLEPALDGWGVMGLVIDPAGTDPRRHPIGASVAGAPPVPEPLQACRDGDPALIVYTSGSTARPKGVVHRISSLIENARLYGDAMGIGPDSRFVNLLSMTYLGGYYNLLLLPYACGASTVITPGFSATSILSFWKPIAEHRVNTLWLVPSILSMLLRMDRGTEGEEHCHSVRPLVLCGTAPLPLPTRRAFESRYGVPIYENYALSETLFLTTAAPAEPSPDNSVGTLLDGIELRLVDNRGREVAGGEEGEIVVRTPYRFAGYLDEATGEVADPTEDGWLATGDVGRFLDEEHLAITGRKKDLIIRGGVNISPASIEEVLVSHPAVLECAVVGVTEPTAGEDVVAVLELAEGAALAAVEPELRALCTERLSSIKRPSRYLTLPDFPYTPNGKIQKAKVRAWAAGKLGLGPAADP